MMRSRPLARSRMWRSVFERCPSKNAMRVPSDDQVAECTDPFVGVLRMSVGVPPPAPTREMPAQPSGIRLG